MNPKKTIIFSNTTKFYNKCYIDIKFLDVNLLLHVFIHVCCEY